MNELKLYNTLTRKIETFKPIKKKQVGMYSCGPTVYNCAHIGNLRTFILNDLLKRTLIYNNYKVKHVMNITDVDDKTIKASQEENISLNELTTKYEKSFFQDVEELNIIKPNITLRATENIKEVINLIKILLEKSYAYKTSDGIYFSISKFKNYGKLAQLEKIKIKKSRVLTDEYDKTNPQDFALWKFHTSSDGDVFWETEIGRGRPGWHIECSAMAMKSLGKTFDIHSGAVDLMFPHHTNEIAQSEAATGKKFVNFWIHGEFLNMKEGKMSKSLGNILTLKEIKSQGFSPLHFRYLCLLTHYRKPLNFTFENLEAAKNTYERLKRKIIEIKKERLKGQDKTKYYNLTFLEAINDELNTPKAIQTLWQVVDDLNFDSKLKIKLIEKFDSVLGLGLKKIKEEKAKLPVYIKELIIGRQELRKQKKFAEADMLREKIKSLGYLIEDKPNGFEIRKVE
ncbi:cysteine--tRNA ligase [Candidatus Pacearchaeota archaeon]|nr:cysteine--tRNA ligase [Candidatus Pacearchaeota archaeon]